MKSKSLVLTIEDPLVDGEEKFEKAVAVLAKATKTEFEIEHTHGGETTPYKAVRDHTDTTHKVIEDALFTILSNISKEWLGLTMRKAVGDSDPYKLAGKVFINPKTGKQLTNREWKAIQKSLTKVFGHLYGKTAEAITKQALAMGKILQEMNPNVRYLTGTNNINLDLFTDVVKAPDIFRSTLAWSNIHTGELIQEMTAKSRRKVVDRILTGYENGESSRDLQESLFEEFSTMNKDWRRIVETEIATNFNNGYLKAEIHNHKGLDPIFMMGISGAGACSFCAGNVDGNVFVLLESPPGIGETVEINGETYTAIWPGKNNFGRKRADWWVSSGTQHPHCLCTFTYIDKNVYEYEKKLKEAME